MITPSKIKPPITESAPRTTVKMHTTMPPVTTETVPDEDKTNIILYSSVVVVIIVVALLTRCVFAVVRRRRRHRKAALVAQSRPATHIIEMESPPVESIPRTESGGVVVISGVAADHAEAEQQTENEKVEAEKGMIKTSIKFQHTGDEQWSLVSEETDENNDDDSYSSKE